MVVPHEPGMLALAAVLLGHAPKPKIKRLCRERLTSAIRRLRTHQTAGPFAPASPAMASSAEEIIRRVCRTCGECRGV